MCNNNGGNHKEFTVTVHVTEYYVNGFIEAINRANNNFNGNPITMQELENNSKLLQYIIYEAYMDGDAVNHPQSLIDKDGWLEVEEYR